MARKTKEELDEIKLKYNVDSLWSWSKYNCYKIDTYEYFLKYIKHVQEDKRNSIYSVSGSVCHDIIERYYKGDLTQKQMITEYENELLSMNLAEYKYNRSDSEKNDLTANKYESCIKHFFQNHVKPDLNMALEMYILIQISDKILFQGYIDNTAVDVIDNEKHIIITDYKTSTIYRGEKLKKESGQLFLYAEGIRQKTKLPLDHIHIRYLFLKYVTVDCLQANGKWKERQIERNSIGESLSSNIKMWLKKLNYSEIEVENYISDVVLNNSIDGLPQEIKDKFIIKDCYVEVDLDEQIIDDIKNDIILTVSEINDKQSEYKNTQDENLFWQEVTDEDSFRLSNLSGYSRKLHKPYNEYLEAQEMFHNEENKENDDLSWLNDL